MKKIFRTDVNLRSYTSSIPVALFSKNEKIDFPYCSRLIHVINSSKSQLNSITECIPPHCSVSGAGSVLCTKTDQRSVALIVVGNPIQFIRRRTVAWTRSILRNSKKSWNTFVCWRKSPNSLYLPLECDPTSGLEPQLSEPLPGELAFGVELTFHGDFTVRKLS